MPDAAATPAVAGLTDVAVLPPSNGHHRWSVRRDGRAQVLHVAPGRLRAGRARRAAAARLEALVALGAVTGIDPVLDGGFVDGELWWTTAATGAERTPPPARTVDDVVRLAVDLAAGLGRLHAGGLVSGEVTPDAVVLAEGGARLAVSPRPPEPVLAAGGGPAPLHRPPEVLEGRAWTPAADLWGLASTVHTLLEGRAPYEREAALGVPEVLLAVTLGTRVAFQRPDVAEPLRRVIERGLDPDPERRPSASAFGAAVVAATGAPLADRLDTVAPVAAAGAGAGAAAAAPSAGLDDGGAVGRPLGSAYVLVEPIGRGGMGRVWRAVRRVDGSAVAVKVLRPELADDPDQVSRFLTERTALRSVVDPRVVRVHDLVVEGSVLAIVMELVVGEDLRTRLRAQDRLAPGEAVRLLAGVAGGLAAVHAAGIVHRDVKPENVLVPAEAEPDAPVKLTDFGIARIVDGATLTRPTQLVGTPDYVAPELAAGRSPAPPADVYALGVLAYELLTGRRPFVGSNAASVLRAHLEDAPTPPPGLDPTLWGIVAACLAKAPEDRPSAEVLAGWLANVRPLVADHPALAPLPATPAPTGAALAASAAPSSVGPPVPPAAGPAVPVPPPVVLGNDDASDDGGDRLATRAGAPLAEPEVEAAATRPRWPVFSALALVCLVVVGIGWFTARRDREAGDDGSAPPVTTAVADDLRVLNLPFDQVARLDDGRIELRLPDTLSRERFAQVREVRVQVYPAGQSPTTADPVLSGVFDPTGGGFDGGDGVLTTDRLPADDPDGFVDTLTVTADEGQCVLVEVPYRGDDLLPAEVGFSTDPPTTCTEITK